MLLLLLLLPAAILLPLRAQAGWIIGGNVSSPHSRPYMAYLEVSMGPVNTQTCGGLLVKKDFVLTAAHCSCIAGNITVILGAHNVHEPEETQQRLRVRHIIPHPEFTRDPFTNDLLLLQLEKKVEVTKEVKLLRLPSAHSTPKAEEKCLVAGWGLTSPNAFMPPSTLHEVQVQVLDEDTCTMFYPGYEHASMLCAGRPFQRGSAYMGDSGGPLVCNGVPQGIVSYGRVDGSPPAIYTRLTKFVPWIRRQMRLFQQ
ncbi:mast cell protease 1A-like [Terrapene carolina triunguis]|uniref:mast cell protease 1A-like n=1 Tax=Terrapene triunguis TaxID=2587831 RepID=UPI000CEFD84E|nr:mast cell protease 1A-like [Terrapene carolina triunguis]